ncbi:MAG TPA: hypothetical protein VMN57_08530 [Anaerolineales bacterium]|nr:hypothetical protein [Anaerolineales bacterium]
MRWNEVYERERRAALAPVEIEFRTLPAPLREPGRLFRANLLAASGAEDLSGVFSGPEDHPGLDLHHFVLDGAGAILAARADELTRAAFFTAAALHLSRSIEDPDSLTTERARPLRRYLEDRASAIFTGIFSAGSPFRKYYKRAWARDRAGPGRLAPLKLASLGALILADWTSELERVDDLLETLNAVFSFIESARGIRRDLQAGRSSAFLLELMLNNGIAADEPDWAARLMGALVLSDALGAPAEAVRTRLDGARSASAELGLVGLAPYLDHLDGALDRVRAAFRPSGREQAGSGLLRPAIDTQKLALETAAAFLNSDLAFRESWEIHRYGLFGRDEVISRFPAGLALEVLCETGSELPGIVDAFVAGLARQRFGYFDLPDLVLRDADTLGLALRLWDYGTRPEGGVREALEEALAVMGRSVLPDGRVPVWLGEPPDGVRLAGEGCGVVEAHLLLGLLAFDVERFKRMIVRSAAGLFDRFTEFGAGISVNYPALYSLSVVSRLAAALERAGITAPGWETWGEVYRAELEAELDRSERTPQEAAFAIMASTGPAADRFEREWPVRIRKHQRPDGSWNAEPFCFVANRGNEASWYASRTLTTAFCFRSLKMISKNGD